MNSLRVLYAFLVRDAVMTMSYRVAFAIQIFSLFFSLFSTYFMAKLVGSHFLVDDYGGYLPFAVIGMAMASFLTTGFGTVAGSIRREQMMGTLEAMLMTPASISMIVMGSLTWNFVWTTLNAIVTLGAAWLIFDIHLQGNMLLALLMLGLTTITFCCLGIVSASYIMVFKKGDPFKTLVGPISFLMGGVVFPIDLLPEWMQKISVALPITHGLQGVRDILLQGQSLSQVYPQIVFLILFIAIAFPGSIWIFRMAVNFAKREGSLVHY